MLNTSFFITKKIIQEYKLVCKFGLQRAFLRFKRTQEVSAKEYANVWKNAQYKFVGQPLLYKKNNRPVLIWREEYYRNIVRMIHKEIESIRPTNILELGSGDGMYIFSLAILNPNISFTGLELTQDGVTYSEALFKNPPLATLSYITGLSDGEILNRIKMIKLSFVKGSMFGTNFEKNSFSFIYTHLAIEQVPKQHITAFKEIKRLLKPDGFALLVESFQEAQSSIFHHIYLWGRDYFRESLTEIIRCEFKLVNYQLVDYQKYRKGVAMALVKS